jgi:hypothetical protein
VQGWHLILNDAAAVGRLRAKDVIRAPRRRETVIITAYGDLTKAQGFEVASLRAVTGQAGLVAELSQRAAAHRRGGRSVEAGQAGLDRVAGINQGVAGVNAGTADSHQRPPSIGRLRYGT